MKKSNINKYFIHNSSHSAMDVNNWSRRLFLNNISKAGLLFCLPASNTENLFFDLFNNPEQKNNLPVQPKFTRNKTNNGMVSQFGDVQAYSINGSMLPFVVTARENLAMMDMTDDFPFIRIGKHEDKSSILLTSKGVQIGQNKGLSWNSATYKVLIDTIKKDKDKTQGILLLRSTLMTSFPASVAYSKEKVSKKMSNTLNNIAKKGYSSDLFQSTKDVCEKRTKTEERVTPIEKAMRDVMTAEEQWRKCKRENENSADCKAAGDVAANFLRTVTAGFASSEAISDARNVAKAACAAVSCVLSTFEDIVRKFIEVVGYVVEEVIVEYFVCPISIFVHGMVDPGITLVNDIQKKVMELEFPNPFDLVRGAFEGVFPPPVREIIDKKAIDEAIRFLEKIRSALGPFGKCLLGGEWSIASLQTGVKLLGNEIDIPYGLRVCISSTYARRLDITKIEREFNSAWISSMGLLGALNPSVATAVTSIGIPIPSTLTAAVALLPPAVAIAATTILGFIIFALFHAAILATQLSFHINFTNNLSDGYICIEHATFAVALVGQLALAINNPLLGTTAIYVPPIVTG